MTRSIRNHIISNNMKAAALELVAFTEEYFPRYYSEAVVHASNLHELIAEERQGLQDPKELRRERRRIRHAILALLEVVEAELEPSDKDATTEATVSDVTTEVFISYSWSDSAIADEVDSAFQARGRALIRDVRDAPYRADIPDFMKRLGQGSAVVLLISDAYLKSRNCMFEALELLQHADFSKRIFPVVLPSGTTIYDEVASAEYVQFWDARGIEIDTKLRALPSMSNAASLFEELSHVVRIKNTVDDFIARLRRMNALTLEAHRRTQFQEILRLV